jgi:hypothetical protein
MSIIESMIEHISLVFLIIGMVGCLLAWAHAMRGQYRWMVNAFIKAAIFGGVGLALSWFR